MAFRCRADSGPRFDAGREAFSRRGLFSLRNLKLSKRRAAGEINEKLSRRCLHLCLLITERIEMNTVL